MEQDAVVTLTAEPQDGAEAKDETTETPQDGDVATCAAAARTDAANAGGGLGGREEGGGQGSQELGLQDVLVEHGGRPLQWRNGRPASRHSSFSSIARSSRLTSAAGGTPAARSTVNNNMKSFTPAHGRQDSPRPTSWASSPHPSATSSGRLSWGGGSGVGVRGACDVDGCSSEGGWSIGSGGEEGWRVVGAAHEGYRCQVCLEDQPASAGFLLSACQHTFCRDCLKAFIKSKVSGGQVYPACFFVPQDVEEGDAGSDSGTSVGATSRRKHIACGVTIRPADIDALIGSDIATRRKYRRFLFCRENKTARECPRCSYLQRGDPAVPEMRCRRCGKIYCYEHGGAHEGMTCSEYVESTADETERTLDLIGRLTKPCPACHTPVEKLGGCNQMVCYHCDTSFCWICGAQVDRGTFPVHFQWWNINGCPNQQLQEDAPEQGGGRLCHKVVSFLQIVVIGPLAFVLTVASSLLCACCLPAFNMRPRELFMGCISGWGNLVMLLPVLPFLLAAVLAMGMYHVIVLPFRVTSALRGKYRQRARRGMDTLSGTAAANLPDCNFYDPAKLTRDSSTGVGGGGAPGPSGVTAGDVFNASGASVTRRAAAAAAAGLGPGSGPRRAGDRVPAQRSPGIAARSTTLSPFAAMLGLDSRDYSEQELSEVVQQQQQQQRKSRRSPSSGRTESYGGGGSGRSRSSSNDGSRSDSDRSHRGTLDNLSSLPPSTVPGDPPPPAGLATAREPMAASALTVASRKNSSSSAGSKRSDDGEGGDFTRNFVSVLAGEAKEAESDADISGGSSRTTTRRGRSEQHPATASGEPTTATPAVNMTTFREMLGYLLGTAPISAVPTAAAAGAGSGAGGGGSLVQHRGGFWDAARSLMTGARRREEGSGAELPVVGVV